VPSFLIKVTWGRWQTDEPWIPAGELQAAALFDLRFSNNKLSVWKIEDDKTNLDRVIAALAVNTGRKNIERVDYVLLDPKSIEDLAIRVGKSQGKTPDTVANDEWHFDLVELTAAKIVAIAKLIKEDGKFDRKNEPAIKSLISKGLRGKQIDINLVDEYLRPKIQGLA
jgi:hypothetical protein